MDDAVDFGMSGKDIVKCLFVSNVELIEMWSFVANQLDPIQDFFERIRKVINNYDLVTRLEECKGREAPNVSGSTTLISVRSKARKVSCTNPVMRIVDMMEPMLGPL